MVSHVHKYINANDLFCKYQKKNSSCLQSWLEQDTSCPTCRLGLSVQNSASIHPDIDRIIDEQENTTRANNHFFHFNGKFTFLLNSSFFVLFFLDFVRFFSILSTI